MAKRLPLPELNHHVDQHTAAVVDEVPARLQEIKEQATTTPATEDGEQKKGSSAADALSQIGHEFDLWHDVGGVGYATRGRESFLIRSKPFKSLLVCAFRKKMSGKVPNSEAISNAITAIEASAIHDGKEHPAFARVAHHNGKSYLSLADAGFTVIEIDGDGWRVCANPPVRFRRTPSMHALPMPLRGGDLDILKQYVNVPEDGDFALLKAWLLSAVQADAPCPLLVLTGEQGSAKTTTEKTLKKLIDPSAGPVRSEPREPRDLMIAALNGWVLPFDNISTLPVWMSDCFCRLATGGGFSTRALYTDSDEIIFDARRPVILNGIEDFVTRGDLLERAILLRHPTIKKGKRRLESAMWDAFEKDHPRLLGALLDRVSAALHVIGDTTLDDLPRMADFARLAVAGEKGSGEKETFLTAYTANQAGAHEAALEDSCIVLPLVKVMEGYKNAAYKGSASDLLALLEQHAPNPKPKDWPKRANSFTGRLRRVAPALRRVYGLDVDCDQREADKSRRRVVTIKKEEQTR